jgi:hypothetical protein
MNAELTAKSILVRTPALWVYNQWQVLRWNFGGKTIPDVVKEQTVKEYAERFQLHTFIETGTYLGKMVNAVKDVFEQVYSIELSNELYQYTERRFAKNYNIGILHGDSGEVLENLLPHIHKPCLFWLDGHYSGGETARGDLITPIQKELHWIFNHSLSDVILIDDARLFTGENDYPTIAKLQIASKLVGYNSFEVKDDIIRVWR